MIDSRIQAKLRERFNPDSSVLRRHQLCALEILKEIHKLCERHNIKYYLSSGTLLGAVRHGGYIPWDDDVDIEMRWFDYLRFLKYAKKELKGKFRLQSHGTDDNYFAVFAKVRNENTLVSEQKKHDLHYKYRGVFIDILYTERISRIFTVLSRKTQLWIISLSKKNPYKVVKPLCTLLYYFNTCVINNLFRIINLPFLPFCHSHLALGHGFMKKRDNSDIFPLGKIKFENYEFYCPKDNDAYLRKLYGDYMKLPDIDKINNIHSTKTIIPENY